MRCFNMALLELLSEFFALCKGVDVNIGVSALVGYKPLQGHMLIKGSVQHNPN